MLLEFLGLIVCVLLLIQFSWNRRRDNGNAPSFYSFPILGHLPWIGKYSKVGLHAACNEWSKMLGPMFRIDFASYGTIILNDYKLIKEAFNIPALCGRILIPVTEVRMGGDGKRRGLIFNDDLGWTEQRRFVLKQLKDFGIGKSTMENIILDECAELIQTFHKSIGKPISTKSKFNATTINSLWTVVAGQRFKHDDPKLAEIVACLMENQSSLGGNGLIVFMPTLAKWFPKLLGWTLYLDTYKITRNFIENFVNSRLASFKDGVINDFTDAYIQEIKNTTDPNSSFYKDEGVKSLIATLDDIFIAGGETTSTTLTWICLYLATHLEMQAKLHNEIDEVIGKGRMPSLTDRSRMPYCEALISEVLRKCPVAPLGVSHFSKENVNFNGTMIPKDMLIFSNIDGAHHDKEFWGDPEIFRPERFLSADRKSIIKHDAFIPFSTGKRICPGENLARTELFLVVTSLFQAFQVVSDPNEPKPTLVPFVNGVVSIPHSHQLVFHER